VEDIGGQARLSQVRVTVRSTWIWGAIVAVLGWRVGMSPPSVGLDQSWNAGLAMATHDGLRFGVQVVFSYGPLGFLQNQGVWYVDTAVLSFAYAAALHVALCVALVAVLRRRLTLAPAVVVAFVVASLPLLDAPLALAVLACTLALGAEPSQRAIAAVVLLGASFAALEALVKLSTGPVIAAIVVVCLLGLRARWWQIAGFVVLFVVELVALWLLSGQGIADLPGFLAGSYEVASGYSAAMSRAAGVPGWQIEVATAGAVLLTSGLIAAAYRGEYRDGRTRWASTAVIGLAAFLIYKEGVVRVDAGHLSLLVSTGCVLWLAIPWSRSRLPVLMAGIAILVLAGVPLRSPGPTGLDPVANVRFAADQLATLASESRRKDLAAAGRAAMRSVYRLDRPTRAALAGERVAIEPWEAGVAWAYSLEWTPLPVFQGYSAYTPDLDRRNAEVARSPFGPTRILRENPALVHPEFPTRGLDDRFAGWDPPAQSVATLCNFETIHDTARWQVLARTANRCDRPRPAGSVEAEPGSAVSVPAPGRNEVVLVRVEGTDVVGLERLASLALRPQARHVVVDGARRYRLIAATAADGLLLRGSPDIGGSGPFAQIPGAKTVAVTGAPSTLRFRFFRMRVRPARSAPGG